MTCWLLQYKDKDKVSAMAMVAGECVSIISNYTNFAAQVKSFSKRTPQFFEYPKEEFFTLKSISVSSGRSEGRNDRLCLWW